MALRCSQSGVAPRNSDLGFPNRLAPLLLIRRDHEVMKGSSIESKNRSVLRTDRTARAGGRTGRPQTSGYLPMNSIVCSSAAGETR
jgi:hypothetical protein